MSDDDYDYHLLQAQKLGRKAEKHAAAAAQAYDERRQAILAARQAGASYGQIAKKLGITRGGVASALRVPVDKAERSRFRS